MFVGGTLRKAIFIRLFLLLNRICKLRPTNNNICKLYLTEMDSLAYI